MHLVEVARYTRAHLDHVDGHEATDIFVLIDDGALDRLGDRHLRRRRRRLLRALATGDEDRRQTDQDNDSCGSEGCWHGIGRQDPGECGLYMGRICPCSKVAHL
jgi:hypothetical protein